MDPILILEKAHNSIKLKNKSENSEKIRMIIQNIFQRVGKRLIKKIYEYLISLNEALPQMLINKYMEFKSLVLNKWRERV